MDESQNLTEYLRRLRPAGARGFEGLVGRLLEKLTGHRFFLAHAGSQEGRDLSTGRFSATWIAVEAKRFQSAQNFDRRELLGELAELPEEIDLWILASTVRIPDQIVSVLRKEGRRRGIDVETLDAPPDRLGDLPALCAAYEEIVLPFLAANGVDEDLGPLLEAVRRHPDFTSALEALKARFSANSIGYGQAQAASLDYLRSAFGDARRARVDLGQPINVLENGGRHVVQRHQVLEALESWWSRWPAAPRPFALLGEEGMGKTWALASWLARRLTAPEPILPPTLFLTSRKVGTSYAPDLIAEALAACTKVRDVRFWMQRAEAFAERSPVMRPPLLLVLEGLNEQPLVDWKTLLESLRLPPWNNIATVLTCRPGFWSERLTREIQDEFQVYEVGPYDDIELASALEKGGVRDTHLPRTLEPLLRRPRYLDLTIRHRQALEQSGDVTVDRLLLEDWRDRLSRKTGLLLSDQDFRGLLAQLAEQHRDSAISKREIQDLLPRGDDFLASLEEIITGGIFTRDPLGRFHVEPRRLIQGLGLLLADGLHKVADQGETVLRETMASLLEPDADMDRKVAICRSAVTFAVLEPGFPEAARFVLFEQWIGSRNLSQEDIESFIAYLPASTACYLRLVERFWSLQEANHRVNSLLVQAFFRWRCSAGVQQALVRACEKWLSYVHLYGYPFMRGQDETDLGKLRSKIEERAGRPLRKGERFRLVDELEVIEDDALLWRSAPALLLASLFPIAPFIPALRRWALSRSIMGHPEERKAVAWVLRSSSEDLWPTLDVAVAPLLSGPWVAQQAAWRLLWAGGREEAAPLFDQLPKNLFPPSHYEELYAEDPCRPFWRRQDCSQCAARPDLPDRLVALKLAPHALDPDLQIDFDVRPRLQRALAAIGTDQLSAGSQMTSADHDFHTMEPALAAFMPDLLVSTYQTLIRTLPSRPEEDCEVLLSELDTLTLLLGGRREQRLLRESWERACRTRSDRSRQAEVDLFAPILFHASAKTQLDLLLRRPEGAQEDRELSSCFKRLPEKDIRSLAQGLLESSPRDLRLKLWYLCYQPAAPVIEALGVEWIVDLLDHAEPEIQEIAQTWLFCSGSGEAFDLAIQRGQITPASTRRFAIRMRSQLSYETLAQAIDLGNLSYLIRKRPRDLASFTHDLDHAFRSVAWARDKTLKSVFCKQTLKIIMMQSWKVVEGWVQQAVGQRDTDLIEGSRMMLESLCEALLEIDPACGVELFQALLAHRRHGMTVEAPTGVDVLVLSLFRVQGSGYVETLLREWFDQCTTDKAVFEVALAASAVRNGERLGELIDHGLSSAVPTKKGAAIMLAGFGVHGSRSSALLESIQLHPEGWLHWVRERARQHLERDRRAQEWMRRFAASPDTDEAFAAFRLFLRCVDRRYWTWKDEVLGRTRLPSDRRRYLALSRREIQRAIEKNEKDLEKSFLGEKIPEDKVHPWLKRYLG